MSTLDGVPYVLPIRSTTNAKQSTNVACITHIFPHTPIDASRINRIKVLWLVY